MSKNPPYEVLPANLAFCQVPRFSDNEQKNFVMAVERLYSSVIRLRDVAYGDNWDRDLDNAWREFNERVIEAIPAKAALD